MKTVKVIGSDEMYDKVFYASIMGSSISRNSVYLSLDDGSSFKFELSSGMMIYPMEHDDIDILTSDYLRVAPSDLLVLKRQCAHNDLLAIQETLSHDLLSANY